MEASDFFSSIMFSRLNQAFDEIQIEKNPFEKVVRSPWIYLITIIPSNILVLYKLNILKFSLKYNFSKVFIIAALCQSSCPSKVDR